jgi:hypothetical protein
VTFVANPLCSETDEVIRATRRWLEKSVIGLKLCPFAQGVYTGNLVRFRVSDHASPAALLNDLRAELLWLQSQDPTQCETTLLIHPHALTNFRDYNDFLEDCAGAIAELGLEGELQIASFHPRYQFAGTQPEDIENYTNRSPYPMLHLLREASLERAIANIVDTDEIYQNNIRTLRNLGLEGWRRLWREET